MRPPFPQSSRRLERIDVLRGVAIVLVVLHHFFLNFTQIGVKPVWLTALGGWNDWLFAPAQLGYLGVQLFFVLSGFCIHNSYLGWRQKTLTPTTRGFLLNYFNRRFWRIYPPYLLALLVTFAIVYWPVFDARAFRHLALNAALINTLFKAFFYNINPAFWSIAVEWQLYLLYPALLWLMRGFGVWKTVMFATLITIFWRFGLPRLTDNFAVLHLPFHWWFEWCLGFLIAELRSCGQVAFPQSRLLAAILIPATVVGLKLNAPPFLAWLLPPLAFAALLQAVCVNSQPLGMFGRWLCRIGISSYSLYLLHNPVLWFFRSVLKEVVVTLPPVVIWVLVFAGVFAVAQALAWAMFRWVEQPSIALGGRIERTFLGGAPRRAVTAAVPVP